MDEQLSREHKMVLDAVRYWQKKKCPRTDVMAWDENGEYPADILESFKELDFWAMGVDEEYGGTGRDLTGAGLVVETLAQMDPVLAATYGGDVFLAASEIAEAGTDDQKKEWLPKIAQGSIRTARVFPREGESMEFIVKDSTCILKGRASQAASADLFIIEAVEAGQAPEIRHSILVPAESQGLILTPSDMLGFRGAGTAGLECDGVKVPASSMLGGPDRGITAKRNKQLRGLGDLALAFLATGIARGAMGYALDHAKSRVQFNQPIGNFPAISEKLVTLSMQVRAAGLMARSAAALAHKGKSFESQAAQAALMASGAAQQAGLDGIQITGGYGYTLEYDAQRYMRNAMHLSCAMSDTARIRETISGSMGL